MKTFLKVIAQTTAISAATTFGMFAGMVAVGKAIDVFEMHFKKPKETEEKIEEET